MSTSMNEVATSTVTPLEIRADLEEAQVRAWDRIAAPGAWWTGLVPILRLVFPRILRRSSRATRRAVAS